MTVEDYTCTGSQSIVENSVIVVGAGIAGCALAYALSQHDGIKVTLIERDWSEPDRIVGELLQPGGVMALQKLGLRHCLEGIDAVFNEGYGLFYGDEIVPLPYLDVFNEKLQATEQLRGCSFHHGKFVQSLRQACLGTSGRVEIIEGTVKSLCKQMRGDSEEEAIITGVQCILKDKSEVTLHADLTIAADGCFSKFRSEIHHYAPQTASHFVGLVLKDCLLPMPRHGHVILASPSPILLYQIGSQDTRILVDIPGKLPSNSNGDLKQYMMDVVGPQLSKETQKSFYEALDTQRLRVMPNSFLPAKPQGRDGLLLLGDAWNMRHPLTGGGMTVALNDVVLLKELLVDVKNVSWKSRAGKALLKEQFPLLYYNRKFYSSAINILAMALYRLFSAGDDLALDILRRSCFDYLGLGGIFMRHPVGLLTGITRKPLVLYLHFFSVAFYGMGSILSRPWKPVQDALLPRQSYLSEVARLDNNGQLLMVRAMQFLYSFNYVLYTILCLPVNAILSLYVLYVAAAIMLPLIWTELR
ncbi:hypothetical protein MP228_011320 [Amoeboaphelidium protococcarum]|nr:hypothetical protein MP228_011320 [Amoeboaphelidium protococcarum]